MRGLYPQIALGAMINSNITYVSSCLFQKPHSDCPLPTAEDRFAESEYLMSRLELEYHDPRVYRYNLNAVLSSMAALSEILQKEMEKKGDGDQWKELIKAPFTDDPWLSSITRARNVAIHQRAILSGSKVDIGLFRWRRHKMSMHADLPHDVPSSELLRRWTSSEAGQLFLDEEHSALGEEYGVWRRYHVAQISETEDTLTHLRRGYIRNHDKLRTAHACYGINAPAFDDTLLLSPESLSNVTVLLESDVDQTLWRKWGWVN
ncbi:hypothetical protein [Clavibacter lycopersici]|nr:hypothetical protein [Clavibacter lycopersici]